MRFLLDILRLAKAALFPALVVVLFMVALQSICQASSLFSQEEILIEQTTSDSFEIEEEEDVHFVLTSSLHWLETKPRAILLSEIETPSLDQLSYVRESETPPPRYTY